MSKKTTIVIVIIFCLIFWHDRAFAAKVSFFSDQISNQIIANAANHQIQFILSSDFGPDHTLVIYFENDFDLSDIDYSDIDLRVNDVNVNLAAIPGSGNGGAVGVVVVDQRVIFTQNNADTIANNSKIEILIGLNASFSTSGDQQIFNPLAAGTYKITIEGNSNNTGQLSVAILSSDNVFLQGEVEPELSLLLRNAADTGGYSGCALNSISLGEVKECQYRVAAETNAENGFLIYIKADGNLRAVGDAYIANVTEDTRVQSGVEGYGLAVSAGTGLTEMGDYNDDDSEIKSVDTLLLKSDTVYNYISGVLTTSSLITHRVAISPITASGQYSQKVIYTILANY